MLGMLQGLRSGRRHCIAAMDEAYRRLSLTFAAFLDTLRAPHLWANMTSRARSTGGLVRKDPLLTSHPLVRVHPGPGEKCLFLNHEFITGIEGLNGVESKLLLDFLVNHIVTGNDFQGRGSWQERTVVVFDNQNTFRTASMEYIQDGDGAKPRYVFSLCAITEKPVAVVTQKL